MYLKATITVLVLASGPAFAAIPFNCNSRISLQTAIDFSFPGETLVLSGTCRGPVAITTKNLTLLSRNSAVIDGQGRDAITVNGPGKIRRACHSTWKKRNNCVGRGPIDDRKFRCTR